MPLEEAAAIRSFIGQRISISGRPAFDHVANVHVFAPHPASFDDFVEQLTRLADERLALPIFVGTRHFADEHQPSIGVADAEDGLRPGRREFGATGSAATSRRMISNWAGRSAAGTIGRASFDSSSGLLETTGVEELDVSGVGSRLTEALASEAI